MLCRFTTYIGIVQRPGGDQSLGSDYSDPEYFEPGAGYSGSHVGIVPSQMPRFHLFFLTTGYVSTKENS